MYTPILATLGFIVSADGKETLMVHRNKRLDDQHFGKYNGLGGKMEPGEDILKCIEREIYEESGIICEKTILRGTINWTGFGKNGEDWFGFIFRIDEYDGVPKVSNEEGSLVWKKIDELGNLPMWEGDRHFLPLVFDDDPGVFHGYMPYEGDKPIGWSYTRV
jgi:8-oxo-dGTP diphosphatase